MIYYILYRVRHTFRGLSQSQPIVHAKLSPKTVNETLVFKKVGTGLVSEMRLKLFSAPIILYQPLNVMDQNTAKSSEPANIYKQRFISAL